MKMLASFPRTYKMNATTPATTSALSKPWLGLAVLLLAGFVTTFDLFVVNVAIPAMQSSLNASFAQVGFIVTGYQLAFAALLISGGRLGDLFGRRRLFVLGMTGFNVTSLLCGLAPAAGFLIAARVLQGCTAALLFPQVYASIRANFDSTDSRRAFSLLGMTLGLAAIAGQVLGGWLVQADLFDLGWRSIFLINAPIGVLAVIGARWIPESTAPQHQELDWAGALLIAVGLALLLMALIEGPERHWSSGCLLALASAISLLMLFYRQQEQRRSADRQPLVDMRLLAQPRFALGTLLVLLVYSTSSSFFLCFALLMQAGLGLDPLSSGLIFAPCSVGFVLASLAAPRLFTQRGINALVGGALLYTAAIGTLITQVYSAGATLQPLQLIPILVLLGAGQACLMTPLLNLLLGFVEDTQIGMASGVLSTLQQVGAALGVALVSILFGTTLATDSATGKAAQYAAAFVSGMLYNLIAALLVCLLLWLLARAPRFNK